MSQNNDPRNYSLKDAYNDGLAHGSTKSLEPVTDTETPLENGQGFGGDVVDSIQYGLAQAGGGLAETGYQLTGIEALADARDASNNWGKSQLEEMSPEGREAMTAQIFEESKPDANGETSLGLGEGATNWKSWALQLSSLAGQMVPQIALGGGFASLGAKVVGKVAMKTAAKKAMAGGASKEASILAGKKAAEATFAAARGTAGVGSYAVVGTAISGGMIGNEVRDEVMEMTNEQLDQSNEYRKLYYQLSDMQPDLDVDSLRDLTKRTLADRTATAVQKDPMLITSNLLMEAVGGKFLDDIFRGVGSGSRITNSGKQFAIQGSTEAVQGGIEQYASNAAIIDEGVDPNRDPFEGVKGAAANEGVLGGAIGGVMGAARKGQPLPKHEPLPVENVENSNAENQTNAEQQDPASSRDFVGPRNPEADLEEKVNRVHTESERGKYRGISSDILIAEREGFHEEAARLRAAQRNFVTAQELLNEGDIEGASRFRERGLKIYRDVMEPNSPQPQEYSNLFPAEYVATDPEYLPKEQFPEPYNEKGETIDGEIIRPNPNQLNKPSERLAHEDIIYSGRDTTAIDEAKARTDNAFGGQHTPASEAVKDFVENDNGDYSISSNGSGKDFKVNITLMNGFLDYKKGTAVDFNESEKLEYRKLEARLKSGLVSKSEYKQLRKDLAKRVFNRSLNGEAKPEPSIPMIPYDDTVYAEQNTEAQEAARLKTEQSLTQQQGETPYTQQQNRAKAQSEIKRIADGENTNYAISSTGEGQYQQIRVDALDDDGSPIAGVSIQLADKEVSEFQKNNDSLSKGFIRKPEHNQKQEKLIKSAYQRSLQESNEARLNRDDPQADKEKAVNRLTQIIADIKGKDVQDVHVDGVRGRKGRVKIGDNYQPVTFKLVDMDKNRSLQPTMKKGENQFRDRNRSASDAQIAEIAAKLDFNELGESPRMSSGAPTLTKEGQIVGGNGRVAAIQRAYKNKTAEAYRAELKKRAKEFGLKPSDIDGMGSPVLIRQFDNSVSVARTAIESNDPSAMEMSALEQASVDDRLAPNIPNLEIGNDGSINWNNERNRNALRAFISALPSQTRNSLLKSNGTISPAGIRRFENVLMYKAYGGGQVLDNLVENAQEEASLNIKAALQKLAPKIAMVNQAMREGDLHNINITDHLVEAVELVESLRANDNTVENFANQIDMLTVTDPVTIEIARQLEKNLTSQKALREQIASYYDAILNAGHPEQNEMFGGNDLSLSSLLGINNEQETAVEANAGQDGLGAERPQAPQETQSSNDSGQPGAEPTTSEPDTSAEEEILTTYSEEDIAALESKNKAASDAKVKAEQQAEQKAKADIEANDFKLSGSDRTADVAAAEGQNSLFDTATKVDQAASEAATSQNNDTPEPTEAQQEAGNYKKGHVTIQGLDIAIENERGSERKGTDPDGKEWAVKMAHHYGYIKKTEGADGDHVDVFIGKNPDSEKVFIVDQVNPDGTFDEHKVMLGFNNKAMAITGYKSSYEKGWKVGPIKSMTMAEFKDWLKSGDTKNPSATDIDDGIKNVVESESTNETTQKDNSSKKDEDFDDQDYLDDLDNLDDFDADYSEDTLDNSSDPEPEPKPTSKLDSAEAAIDAEIDALGQELADLFKAQATKFNSGIDPQILAVGAKLGALYVSKGVVKFARWSQAILDQLKALGADPEDVKPALKEMYGATQARVDDDVFDTMDSMRDVRKFDLNSLDGGKRLGDNEENATDKGPDNDDSSDSNGDSGNTDRPTKVPRNDGTGVPVGNTGTRKNGSGGKGGSSSGTKTRPNNGTKRGDKDGATEPRFKLDDVENIANGTEKQRVDTNLAVIRLVKELLADNRKATNAEKAVLAKYTGWGGLSTVFDPRTKKKFAKEALAELESLLTPSELNAIRSSIRNAFYTSKEVVKGMWAGVEAFGLGSRKMNVLEPTVGSGNFIGWQPEEMRDKSNWSASELDTITGNIAKLIYDDANVVVQGFEKAPFKEGVFSLAIGNPPFGAETIRDSKMPDISGLNIHNYIIAKSAKLMHDNGLLMMVVTKNFLDTKSANHSELHKHVDFVGAVRLPNTAFKSNASTEVTTDIVVFRKLPEGQKAKNTVWTDTDGNINGVKINKYYEQHPQNILGRLADDGSMYTYGNKEGDRKELTVHPTDEHADLTSSISAALTNMAKNVDLSVTDEQADSLAGEVMLAESDLPIGGMMLSDGGKVMLRDDDSDSGDAVVIEVSPDTVWSDNGKLLERVNDSLGNPAAFDKIWNEELISEKTKKIKGEYSSKAFKAVSDFKNNVIGLNAAREEIKKSADRAKLGQKKYSMLKDILRMRNTALSLMRSERQDRDDIDALRKQLNDEYDAFTNAYTTKKVTASIDGNLGLLNGDLGIESGLDQISKSGVVTKHAMFNTRMQMPYKAPSSAGNIDDAVNYAIQERGRIDIEYIAGLMGISKDDAQDKLTRGSRPYLLMDPDEDKYVFIDDYLSGNVKRKYEAAVSEGLTTNVKLLKPILPKDKPASKIKPSIRANWMDGEIYERFLEALGYSTKVTPIRAIGAVSVSVSGKIGQPELAAQFENNHKDIPDLFKAAVAGKNLTIYKKVDKESFKDEEATKAVNILINKMRDAFKVWAESDTDIKQKIADNFNERVNTHVERSYNGRLYLKTVGNNPKISLRKTQLDGALRMIQSKNVLLDHTVGAGKTFTAITGIMERKRLGLSKKPLLAVPNHIIGAFKHDFAALYPGSNVLAVSEKSMLPKNRKQFFARIATGNYDAIIIGHSHLPRMENDIAIEEEITNEKIEELRTALEEAREAAKAGGDRGSSVTQIQGRITALQNQLADRKLKNKEKTDSLGFNFSELGVDYLVVDEAHEFKNLMYSTTADRVVGMNDPKGSNKAFDLLMKVRAIQRHAKNGGVAFMTGTPISNSLVEVYTMMYYLGDKDLKENSMSHYDAFAGSFLNTENAMEYTPTGTVKERIVLKGLNSVKELSTKYRQFADVITHKDMIEIYKQDVIAQNEKNGEDNDTKFPVPKVKGGGRRMVIGQVSSRQKMYNDYLIARMEAIQAVKGREERKKYAKIDNPLWVMSDARKASLDIRLVDPTAKREKTGKVYMAAEQIKAIYDKTFTIDNLDRFGEPDGTTRQEPGAQLVFSDMGTPSKFAKANVKKDLIELAKLVMPEGKAKAYVASRLGHYEGNSPHEKTLTDIKDKIEAALESGLVDSEVEDKAGVMAFDLESSAITADTGFSVYDDLKALLIEMGVKEDEIAFIHDANTTAQKDALFEKVNNAEVKVLIGSTPKMGAGTNVQKRLVALHHLDAPFRPSDMEQREGRIIRQGNLFYKTNPDGFSVDIPAYTMQGSSDPVMWQILERKSGAIEQFRAGDLEEFVDDGDSDADSYASFKANSTGNPIYKLKLTSDNDLLEAETALTAARASKVSAERILKYFDSDKRAITNKIEVVDSFNDLSYDVDSLSKLQSEENKRYLALNTKFEEEMEAFEKLTPEEIKSQKIKKPTKPKRTAFYELDHDLAREIKNKMISPGNKAIADKVKSWSESIDLGGGYKQHIELHLSKAPLEAMEGLYDITVEYSHNGVNFSQASTSAKTVSGAGRITTALNVVNTKNIALSNREIFVKQLKVLEKQKSDAVPAAKKDITKFRDDARDQQNRNDWLEVEVGIADIKEEIRRGKEPNAFIDRDTKRNVKRSQFDLKSLKRVSREHRGQTYTTLGPVIANKGISYDHTEPALNDATGDYVHIVIDGYHSNQNDKDTPVRVIEVKTKPENVPEPEYGFLLEEMGEGQKPLSSESSKDYNVNETSNVEYQYERDTSNLSVQERNENDKQGDLFANGYDSTELSSEDSQTAAKDIYAVQTKNHEVATVTVGIDTIKSTADAAHIVAEYRKHAQETMLAIMADENGKVLQVIRHTKGIKDASNVSVAEIAGAMLDVEGATKYWIAHNHPTGVSEPSTSDYQVTKAITDILEGTKLEYKTHIILGQGKNATAFKNGAETKRSVSITAARRGKKIPVTERLMRRRGTIGGVLNSPRMAANAARSVESENAAIILNTQNYPIAVLPLNLSESRKLRGNGRLDRLLKALHKSNASAVIFKTTNITKDQRLGLENVANMFGSAGVRILDHLSVDPLADHGFRSEAERGHNGVVGASGAFFRKGNEDGKKKGASKNKTNKEKVEGWVSEVEVAIGKKVNVVASKHDLPDSVKETIGTEMFNSDFDGVYDNKTGESWIIADQITDQDHAIKTALHEAVGHGGVIKFFVKQQKNGGKKVTEALDDIYRRAGRKLIDKEVGRYGFDYTKEGDRHAAVLEYIAHLAETGKRPSWMHKVIAAIKEAMRSIFPGLSWTDLDTLVLIEKGRNQLKDKDSGGGFGGGSLMRLSDDRTDIQKEMMSRIGPKTLKQSVAEGVKLAMNGWRLKVRQGVMDRFAALLEMDKKLLNGNPTSEENITSSSWVRARMSNAASGAVSALMTAGRVFLDPEQGVLDVREGSHGLVHSLNKLGGADEVNRFLAWIAANRSDKLNDEGREFLFSNEEIEAGMKLNEGRLHDGRNRNQVYGEVFAEFQQHRDDVLAIAEQAGIITPENREQWSNEFYVPFYRIMEDDDSVQGAKTTNGLSRQQAYKKLKGGTQNINNLLENTVMNFHHLIDASMKNIAAKQAMDNAMELDIATEVNEATKGKQSTFVLRDGKKVWYNIEDDMVFQSLTALNSTGMNGSAMKAMRWFKRTFTSLTTSTPQFLVANLLRDSLSSMAVADLKYNPVGNVVSGVKGFGLLDKTGYERARLLASGGAFSFGHIYGEDADAILYQIDGEMRRANVVKDPKSLLKLGLKPMQAAWDKWQDVSNGLENANRMAAFQQAESAGKGTLYAAHQARDMMDFSGMGAWPAVRFLIDVVPFMNARLQGLDKLYRAGVKPTAKVVMGALGVGDVNASVSEKKAAARFMAVVGALSMATMALYLHNKDDEEYEKLEDWHKDSYWWLRIPGTEHVITIPKPFEVGAIATLTERLLEQAVDDKATGKLFAERLGHMLSSTFSFTVIPQMLQPALDVYANKDNFTGRQIETMGQRRLSPSNRTNSRTTAVAEYAGKGLESLLGSDSTYALSPVQIDHLIGGYFGQVGAWGVAQVDIIKNSLSDNEKANRHWYEYQPIRRFYKNLGDPGYDKQQTLFYEALRNSARINADINQLKVDKELGEVESLKTDNKELLLIRKKLNRVSRRLTTINSRLKKVNADSSLSADEKRREIDLLRIRKNALIDSTRKLTDLLPR